MKRALWMTLLALGLVMAGIDSASAGGDWNDQGIQWRQYEEGLAQAKTAQKPVCLIFFTEWCPHCTNYSKVFHEPAVVERAKDFVMIRVEADKNRELAGKHEPDGGYVPRTLFLSPSGAFDPDLRDHDGKYQYFYSEKDPAPLLAKMAQAVEKYPRPKSWWQRLLPW